MSSFRPYEIRSELYPPGDPINYEIPLREAINYEDPKNPIDYTCVNLYRDYDKNIQSYANKCAEFSIELDNLTKPANFIQHTREILTHKKEAIFPTQITPYDIDERYAHENPNNRLGRLEKQEILNNLLKKNMHCLYTAIQNEYIDNKHPNINDEEREIFIKNNQALFNSMTTEKIIEATIAIKEKIHNGKISTKFFKGLSYITRPIRPTRVAHYSAGTKRQKLKKIRSIVYKRTKKRKTKRTKKRKTKRTKK